MKNLFDTSSFKCSKLITNTYSTSFSLGIKLFSPHIRTSIYAIYGFVRYADEIVDSFHDYKQDELLYEFEADYKKALDRKISMNPILNAFQDVVHRFELASLVDVFLDRMKYDLEKKNYHTVEDYENYIYGSADVIGLMCLRVFVDNDEKKFQDLKGFAMNLGSAFQKVNFLRDIKADLHELGRSYFPNLQHNGLDNKSKAEIIEDIESDFSKAYKGIVQLPMKEKFGVYLAYRYYLCLLKKLKKLNSEQIMNARVRVSNPLKMTILMKSYIRYKFNII